VPGAAFGNWVGGHLLSNAPRVGAVDTAINLTNSALQVAGAPSKVTDVTGLAASATPSSFGGAVVSNAGRGIYNAGDYALTGNSEGLRRQGDDIMHGRSGAPLQGLGIAGQAIHHSLTDRRNLDVSMGHIAGREAARGDYGVTPRLGVNLGDDWFGMVHRDGGLRASLGEAGEGAALAGRDAANAVRPGVSSIANDWSNMAHQSGELGAGLREAGEGALLAGRDGLYALSRAGAPVAHGLHEAGMSLANDWSGIVDRPMASFREAGQGAAQAGHDAWNWVRNIF